MTLGREFDKYSRAEFVELLKQQGATKVTPEKATAPEPPSQEELQEIEQLQQEVDLVAQFLAVRRVHEIIRKSGETPELLGLLVNGYANLGLLTECTWNADTKVFKARCLLYADRLRNKYENYLFSRWHWAYAQAMTGMHFRAIEQLEDPIPEQEEDAELPSLPLWAELVDPLCRYDTATLQTMAEHDNRWARYLQLWTLAMPGADRQIDTTAHVFMQECPGAFNIYTLLGQEGSLGIMHAVHRASTQAMAKVCAEHWSQLRDLPAAVRHAALTPPSQKSTLEAWGQVIEALRQEEDESELSWQMLANLLQDTAEMVAAANLRIASGGSQEHSLAPYVDMFWPALKNHPHASYFESRKYSKKTEHEKIQQICQNLRFEDPSLWIGYSSSPVWSTLNVHGEKIGYNARNAAQRDGTAMSLSLVSRRGSKTDWVQGMFLGELRLISPHSPLVLVHEIRNSISKANEVPLEKISAWKERAGSSAGAWYQLGQFHVSRQEYNESYECFQKSFDISPEERTATAWAYAYEWAGDFEKVVPTFKKYLEVPDYGLGHSRTHSNIAHFYLRQGKPKEAKPHALSAAQSGSAWGFTIAGTVCERLQQDQEADQWYHRASSAYPTSAGLDWYLYRRRTGNPDLTEARELALRTLGSKEQQETTSTAWWSVTYHLMESNSDRATELLKLRIEAEQDIYGASHLLCLALAEQDKSQIDLALAKLQEEATGKDAKEGDWNSRYAETVQAALQCESQETFPADRIEELLKANDAMEGLCNTSYFFSKIAQAREFAELASKYRNQAITSYDTQRITWHLACYEASRAKADRETPAKTP
jgi:tetratricopeptide (TPR) repeat protein